MSLYSFLPTGYEIKRLKREKLVSSVPYSATVCAVKGVQIRPYLVGGRRLTIVGSSRTASGCAKTRTLASRHLVLAISPALPDSPSPNNNSNSKLAQGQGSVQLDLRHRQEKKRRNSIFITHLSLEHTRAFDCQSPLFDCVGIAQDIPVEPSLNIVWFSHIVHLVDWQQAIVTVGLAMADFSNHSNHSSRVLLDERDRKTL